LLTVGFALPEVVEVTNVVGVADVLSAGDGVLEELVWSVDRLVGVRESGLVLLESDLSPESLFIAPRIASTTPVMPTVQMMMAAHLPFEMVLYQGTSAGSTQTFSLISGSLLPGVPKRREERVS
jgi:hypothetical protein